MRLPLVSTVRRPFTAALAARPSSLPAATVAVAVAVAMAVAASGSGAVAALNPIAYDGRPLLDIPGGTNVDRAQFAGTELVFSRLDALGEFRGFQATRGETPRTLVPPGIPDPAPGATRSLLAVESRFAVSSPIAPGAASEDGVFVFAAGEEIPDALYLYEAASVTRVVAPGSTIPGAAAGTVLRFGPPHLAGRTVAVHGYDPSEEGTGFEGVFRVALGGPGSAPGPLESVATTAEALPGPVGQPNRFHDQPGFDGLTVGFQASRGSPDSPDAQGVFLRTANGAVTALQSTGDPLPGGGPVAWLDTPPVVQGQAVAWIAVDADLRNWLLRRDAAGTAVVARDGDPAPEGGVFSEVGLAGLLVQGSRTLFTARTAAGPGVYLAEGGSVTALVSGGRFPLSSSVAVVYPFVNLLDAQGPNLALQWLATAGSSRDGLKAVFERPSVPVVLSAPQPGPVSPGGRLELKLTVAGDPPLRFLWSAPGRDVTEFNGDTLVVENAEVSDRGKYLVAVTNAYGRSELVQFEVQIEAPPSFTRHPQSLAVPLGDPFILTCLADGASPSGIRWQRNEVFIDNPGAANTYGRQQSILSDAGVYRAIATNAWGSATSQTARLSIQLPPPAPDLAGRRIEPLFSEGLSVLSANLTSLAPESLVPGAVRWLDDRLALAGINPDGTTPAVFTHLAGSLAVWFRAGGSLPNNLGPLNFLRVVPAASAGDPLHILGGADGRFFGLYRIETTTLIPLADLSLAAPGNPGAPPERFSGFPGPAAQAGARIAFVATTPTRQGVFVWADQALHRLLDSTQNLPGTGAIDAFTAVGFDGHTAAVLATAGPEHRPRLLRVDPEGAVTSLLAAGDPVPGLGGNPARTITALAAPVVEDGVVFLTVTDDTGARHLLVWRDGTWIRLAAPGTVASGLGIVVSVETDTVVVDAGRVAIAASLSTASGLQEAILSASLDATGIPVFAPLFTGRAVDGVFVSGPVPLDWEGDRFAFHARSEAPGRPRVVYANTGSPARPAPELKWESRGVDGLRIPIPEGALLETTESLDAPWIYEPAAGLLEIPTDPAPEASRFFRLRWP